jgi:biopolymer transport protein ExbD
MRRFSQRSALVTLSEINITPLLDLAFVLLIIFVITTPLLTQSIPLKLPEGGQPNERVQKGDVRVVEIDPRGIFYLQHQRVSLDQLEANLVRDFSLNPKLVVRLCADRNGRNEQTFAVIDRCRKHGITRIDLQTEFPHNGR